MTTSLIRTFPVLIAFAVLLISCENDIERINLITGSDDTPTLTGDNIKVLYSDSARVQVQIEAPEYQSFPGAKRPYMEFPRGMHVLFFGDSTEIESEIRSDYAIYYTEEGLWHAKGDVEAKNLEDGNVLNTEELFWDEQEQRIYNNVYTRVKEGENVMYGSGGFEAQQSLENWYLKGTSGEIVIPEEQQ